MNVKEISFLISKMLSIDILSRYNFVVEAKRLLNERIREVRHSQTRYLTYSQIKWGRSYEHYEMHSPGARAFRMVEERKNGRLRNASENVAR